MYEALQNLVKYKAYYTALAAGAMLSLSLLVVFFWSVYPYDPLQVVYFRVVDGTNEPGGMLYYDAKYIKRTDKKEVVSISYVCETNRIDSIVKNKISDLPEGIHEQKGVSLPVPNKATPEKCQLEAEAIYKMNPIRASIKVITLSDPFYIGTPSATVTQ